MIYHTEDKELSVVREIFRGDVNDVVVCEDLRSPTRMRYTLWAVRDRECIKHVLRVFDESERLLPDNGTPYLASFSQNELLCFLFPWREERRLSHFAGAMLQNDVIRETVCINIVMECLSSPMPYPLLYLMLQQDNIHIEKDNSVFFTHYLDLSQLDAAKTEADCADLCAQLLLGLLQSRSKANLKSYRLLNKKAARHAFQGFPELYHDIKVTAIPSIHPSLRQRLKAWWLRAKDTVFRVLLIFCALCIAAALIILISQLIFGDVPLFRLFENAFRQIGTESLLRH